MIFVESDRVAVEMAKLRPYLVLINAKSVPQTVRQIAVRYDEQYDTRKPTCKVGSESAGVVDGKPDNYPGRDCREREPYWCIERCVGKIRGRVGSGSWLAVDAASGSMDALSKESMVSPCSRKASGFDAHVVCLWVGCDRS